MFDPFFIIALVAAVTIHEFSHAWMATILGDPTARLQGRVTLNPFKHLDPIGTILLFVAGIGWGKPVPFDIRYLKYPRRDSALIAIAGPTSNLIIAILCAPALRYLLEYGTPGSWPIQFLTAMVSLNLVLMLFNLLPLPPLDGSKIVFSLFPVKTYPLLFQYRNAGYGILIILLLSPMLLHINILGTILQTPLQFLWGLLIG